MIYIEITKFWSEATPSSSNNVLMIKLSLSSVPTNF
jgi:hypothetical protein